jgi:Ser/Thr protein kinase RdoA (MazF antagonist)
MNIYTKKMKNLFEITNEERNRVLNLHENATKRQYLTEQSTNYEPVRMTNGSFRIKDNRTNQYVLNANNKVIVTKNEVDAQNYINNTLRDSPPQTPEPSSQNAQTNVQYYGTDFVKQAQTLLGMKGNQVDGKFGDKTLAALKAKLGGNVNTGAAQTGTAQTGTAQTGTAQTGTAQTGNNTSTNSNEVNSENP